jgi:hypothetical protein
MLDPDLAAEIDRVAKTRPRGRRVSAAHKREAIEDRLLGGKPVRTSLTA